MAITEKYFNPDLDTGLNDGTSEANAWRTWADIVFTAGERVNAKNPTAPFQPGASISAAVSASDTQPVLFRGYSSTIGDKTKFQFDMEANTLTVSGDANTFYDIDATGTSISQVINLTGDLAYLYRSKVVNTGTTANNHYAVNTADASVVDCYLETNGTDHTSGSESVALNFARGSALRCIIVSTAVGIKTAIGFRAASITDCLVYEKGILGDAGIVVTGYASGGFMQISGNTIDNFVDGIEIIGVDTLSGAVEPLIISGNLITNCTTGIANTDSGVRSTTIHINDCFFYNNTTDTDLDDVAILGKTSLTVDPYTDSSTDDYTLNNTASGGADVRDALQIGAGI